MSISSSGNFGAAHLVPPAASGPDPPARDKAQASNRHVASHCKVSTIGLALVFSEDVGRHRTHNPTLLWSLPEFQSLEGAHDAWRGAGFPMPARRNRTPRPLEKLGQHLNWPTLAEFSDQLRYDGPLPSSCLCPQGHRPLRGLG